MTADTSPVQSTAPLTLAFVIPIKDKASVAERCLRSITAAVDADPNATLVVVDHTSTDGTLPIAERVMQNRRPVLHVTGGHVGRVRNVGAAATAGDWLVFIDGDCVVPIDLAARLRAVIARTGAGVVGCEVGLPPHPNWIEVAWDDVTRSIDDGEVRWLSSQCFAVRRDLFDAVGGFDESRTSGEDVDICNRLRAAGTHVWQFDARDVEHHGNPQSLSGFYKRLRWHGEGAVETDGTVPRSSMIMLLVVHATLLLITLGMLAAVLRGTATAFMVVTILCLPWIAPGILYLRALVRQRTLINPMTGVLLLQTALLARLHGLLRGLRRHRARPTRVHAPS